MWLLVIHAGHAVPKAQNNGNNTTLNLFLKENPPTAFAFLHTLTVASGIWSGILNLSKY